MSFKNYFRTADRTRQRKVTNWDQIDYPSARTAYEYIDWWGAPRDPKPTFQEFVEEWKQTRKQFLRNQERMFEKVHGGSGGKEAVTQIPPKSGGGGQVGGGQSQVVNGTVYFPGPAGGTGGVGGGDTGGKPDGGGFAIKLSQASSGYCSQEYFVQQN